MVKVKLLTDQKGMWGEHLPKGSIIEASFAPQGYAYSAPMLQFGFFTIDPKETCLMEGKAYAQFFGQIYDKKTKRCRKIRLSD